MSTLQIELPKSIDTDADLRQARCDLSTFSDPGKAARHFYCWACELAKLVGMDPPRIYPPNTREESGDCWWVVWEDCDWPTWAVTGGGDISGPNENWESLRNGVHHANPEDGPFVRQYNGEIKQPWYIDTYYGFDFMFTATA